MARGPRDVVRRSSAVSLLQQEPFDPPMSTAVASGAPTTHRGDAREPRIARLAALAYRPASGAQCRTIPPPRHPALPTCWPVHLPDLPHCDTGTAAGRSHAHRVPRGHRTRESHAKNRSKEVLILGLEFLRASIVRKKKMSQQDRELNPRPSGNFFRSAKRRRPSAIPPPIFQYINAFQNLVRK